MINTISTPILVAQPVKDASGTISDFSIVLRNNAFVQASRMSLNSDLYYSQFKEKIAADISWLDMGLAAEKNNRKQEATYYSTNNKTWYRVAMNRTDDGFIVVTFTDITKERRHSQELREIAYHDKLTGLPNRNSVSESINLMIDTSQHEKKKLALMIINIDNLKKTNDTCGHQKGDEIIVQSAQILNHFYRSNLIPYRIGGDEFLLIIAEAVSDEYIDHTTDSIFNEFSHEHISVSCGVAVFPDDSTQSDELLRFADMALQNAKQTGRNRLLRFTKEMERKLFNKVMLEKKITAAVLSCDFTLEYQPQFYIQDGTLRGFEALIRWHDSDLGSVSPSVFIPIAEETDLIIPLGKWVLSTALATLKNWQTKYNFSGVMSVNVSPVQLKKDSFIQELSVLCKRFDVRPESLEIEITEGIMIDNKLQAIEKLNKIKAMGIHVSLDDFGTGYSSLSYLQQLPLTTLKIDKSFIDNITDMSGIQANITSSIIEMVTKMGLETIAEGVEAPDQLELLNKFNCRTVQGFLRGMPMTEKLCSEYLAGNLSALQTLSHLPSTADQ